MNEIQNREPKFCQADELIKALHIMSNTELKKINNYNFDLSVDDDYYYKIFPANWVIKNYNNCDLEVKNKNNMIAVSMYKYE